VATSGEALVSIAERLVEDVMGSGRVPTPGGISNSSGKQLNTSTVQRASSNAAGKGSSSSGGGGGGGSIKRPWYAAGNPHVTLVNRMTWARCVLSSLANVMVRLQICHLQQQQAGEGTLALCL
jgi:subtilase family serine protease